MAKGARASSRKRNNAALRAKIFGPAVDARTERLSAKLQELVSRPKPVDERAMLVDGEGAEKEEQKDAASINIMDGISPPPLWQEARAQAYGTRNGYRRSEDNLKAKTHAPPIEDREEEGAQEGEEFDNIPVYNAKRYRPWHNKGKEMKL